MSTTNPLELLPPPIIVETLYGSLSETKIPVRSSSISIPPNLTHAEITKDTLVHVFNADSSTRKLQGIKHKIAKGYHLLDDDFFNFYSEKRYFYAYSLTNIGKHVSEGFITIDKTHLPTYKTFFQSLTKEEVLQLLNESIQNVIEIDHNNQAKWKLKGISNDGIHITTIVDKQTLAINTFFPTPKKTKQEIDELAAKERNRHIRYFFNPCYKSSPWETCTIEDISNYFGNGVIVNIEYVNIDCISAHYNRTLDVRAIPIVHQMERTILPSSIVELLKGDRIGHNVFRQVETISSWERFTLPKETIDKVFFSSEERFPSFLHPFYVLDKLKEGIANFIEALNQLYQETKESDWEEYTKDDFPEKMFTDHWYDNNWPIFPAKANEQSLPVTSKYALERAIDELDSPSWTNQAYTVHIARTLNVTFEWIPTSLFLPYVNVNESFTPPTAFLWLYADGSCYMDSWKFVVDYDPMTGIITDFGVK